MNNFNAASKILSFTDKLNLFFNRHKTLISLELDLTNKCNNDCPGCTGIRDNPVTLDFYQVKELVDQMSNDFDLKSIIISGGGEPTLHKNFIEILYYIKSKGISIGLNSNGVAITEKKAVAILECCTYLRISLDAGTPEMYAITHGDNERTFNKVLSNMKVISSLKRAGNYQTSFGVGFLTSNQTIDNADDFVRVCKESNVDFAQLRPFTGDFSDFNDEYVSLKKKYENNDFKVVSSSHKYSHFGDVDKRPYSKCYGMMFNTVVTADYKVYACLHHRQKNKYFLGDLNDTTMKEIWLSPRIIDVYNNIDFCDCPYFCRNDDVNRSLESLSNNISHADFL